MSGGAYKFPMKPVFIDRFAVDMVVNEHHYMKLTAAEKRHAVHGLIRQGGLSHYQIGQIMHIATETVFRLSTMPPPPILDIDKDGQCVLVAS